MRPYNTRLLAAAFAVTALSACAVIPEPVEPVAPPIVVEVPPAPTCFEVSALQRVEIPAETRVVVGITVIENPPYDPIEQRTEREIVTKQAEVYYALVDPETGNQKEVTNLCDPTVPVGPVGPAPGEAINEPSGTP